MARFDFIDRHYRAMFIAAPTARSRLLFASRNMAPARFIPFLWWALSVCPLLGCSTVTEETTVERPCLVDGKQVGTYTRSLKTDGTLVYVFDEACNRTSAQIKPS
jgi:hypothetical protein